MVIIEERVQSSQLNNTLLALCVYPSSSATPKLTTSFSTVKQNLDCLFASSMVVIVIVMLLVEKRRKTLWLHTWVVQCDNQVFTKKNSISLHRKVPYNCKMVLLHRNLQISYELVVKWIKNLTKTPCTYMKLQNLEHAVLMLQIWLKEKEMHITIIMQYENIGLRIFRTRKFWAWNCQLNSALSRSRHASTCAKAK